jgi:hypothetical protein
MHAYEPYRIKTKTAAYQVQESDLGVIFNTVGAGGSVTFTLPVTTSLEDGWHCKFFQGADQNMVIASYGSSDNIIVKNDLGADTITFSTATELIGNGVEMVWDATNSLWMAFLMTEETVTATIG